MSTRDPFTGARFTDAEIDPNDARLGVPPDKLGMLAQPVITADRRQAVILMLYPPESLRDQALPVIFAAINAQAQGILRSIAEEIYRSYTSDPISPDAARTTGEAMIAHADALGHANRKAGER